MGSLRQVQYMGGFKGGGGVDGELTAGSVYGRV